jgi:hypothetical protein
MDIGNRALLKIFSPRILSMVIQAFDRATLIVLGVCWSAFLVMMVFAIYTLKQSNAAKHDSETALVAEPDLPKMDKQGVDGRIAQTIVERLQHLYPDIQFSINGSAIVVSAIDATKFHQWLTSLSYIDTVYPEYRWTITETCIGKCAHGPVMQATLVGEKASFSLPQ